MLWCTSGVGEFWSLTIDERKQLLELAIAEARATNPDVVIQACTAATSAKDCLELTLHAQQSGADIVYIQTPMMECHGGEGVLRFFSYIAERTDIALGMFNSPSSGYVLSAAESARIYDEIPAVCATKEGAFRPANSRMLHELAPDLVVWECDRTVYRAGWLRDGIVCPAQLGTVGLPLRDPAAPHLLRVLGADRGRPADRGDGLRARVRARPVRDRHGLVVHLLPGPPRLLHPLGCGVQACRRRGGSADRFYPHSRPPQAELPAAAKTQIEDAYKRLGLVA